MSYAELTANRLYDAMHLDCVSDGEKRPLSYKEAIKMGAIDIEKAREELHSYVDELATQYGIK